MVENAHSYLDRLYTATNLVKIDDYYFIIDCWHHRIIYSKQLDAKIENWHILDDNIAGPHSIVSDGQIYVAEDTGRHNLLVWARTGDSFYNTQILENIGLRPHRVLYNNKNRHFYAVGSWDQSLFILENVNNSLVVANIIDLKHIKGKYCRSITIRGEFLYVIAGDTIAKYLIVGNSIEFIKNYPLNIGQDTLNDLYFFENGSALISIWPLKICAWHALLYLKSR
jgi:hypothetical protein